MSTNNLEQLAAAQKANAEVMMALVRTAFNGMEQLAASTSPPAANSSTPAWPTRSSC